jgi:hypothetical protein
VKKSLNNGYIDVKAIETDLINKILEFQMIENINLRELFFEKKIIL